MDDRTAKPATTIQGEPASPGQQRPPRNGTPRQATPAGTPRAAGTPRTKSGGPSPRRGTPRTGTPRPGGAGTPTKGGAASPRAAGSPRTAAAQAPELGGTDGSGVADPSWVTKLVAREAELGGTAEREAAVTRMQARQRGKLDRRHTAGRVEQGEMAGQQRAKKAAEQESLRRSCLTLTPNPNPNPVPNP